MKKIGSILLILIFGYIALAQDDKVTVSATVDRNQMRPGDTFTYTINVSSEGQVDASQPSLPDLSNFELLNTWTSSETRASFINGQVNSVRSQIYNYMLTSTREGKHTIAAAEVVVNGTTYRTNPIEIEVNQAAADAASPRQRDNGDESVIDQMQKMEEDLFSQLLRRRFRPQQQEQINVPVDAEDAFFVQVEVDKTKVYENEQVLAQWYLVTRAGIADIDTLKYPGLSGFWKEDIEVATRLNFQPIVIRGVQYNRALLASYALFPIKAGQAVIDSYTARCRIVGLNSLGAPQDRQVTKSSQEIKVNVMPLPEKEKHPQYSGGVGDFNITRTVDSMTSKTNTPVSLKVRIEGTGNAKMAELPNLNLPAGIDLYDTKSEMKFYQNGRSYKQFEILLVPREVVEKTLPAINVEFFNPETAKYYTKTLDPIVLQVTQGEAQNIISSSQLLSDTKEALKEKLILPPHATKPSRAQNIPGLFVFAAWGAIYLITFFGLGIFARLKVFTKRVKENLEGLIKRRMSDIKSKARAGHWREVGVESTNLIHVVVGEIAGAGGAIYEIEKLTELAPPSFRRDIVPKLRSIIAKLDIIGFAPEELVGDMKKEHEISMLLQDTERLLLEMSKYDFSMQI